MELIFTEGPFRFTFMPGTGNEPWDALVVEGMGMLLHVFCDVNKKDTLLSQGELRCLHKLLRRLRGYSGTVPYGYDLEYVRKLDAACMAVSLRRCVVLPEMSKFVGFFDGVIGWSN